MLELLLVSLSIAIEGILAVDTGNDPLFACSGFNLFKKRIEIAHKEALNQNQDDESPCVTACINESSYGSSLVHHVLINVSGTHSPEAIP